MVFQFAFLFLQNSATVSNYEIPKYFVPVFVLLLIVGLVGSLVAFVLGRGRARTGGPAVKWFSFAALALLFYYLQWFVWVYAISRQSTTLIWLLISFNTLFVFVAVVCAIMGFMQIKGAEPVAVETKQD
ncbi:MAG: hypothetical protein ABIP75_04890 [Pyrinomonadaceae bacterium]